MARPRLFALASVVALGLALAGCSAHERRGLSLGSSCDQDFQCDDAHACNGVERCLAGTCALGATPDCDDGDACTRDGCTEGVGCVHVTRDAPMCRPDEPEHDGGPEPRLDAAIDDAAVDDADSTVDAAVDESEPAIELPADPSHPPEIPCTNVVAQLSATTQEQLDRFDRIECVIGDLSISGEIETLEPLRHLRWVGGNAVFADIGTAHLADLRRLARVDGNLTFSSAGGLYWVHDLDSLLWVGGSFVLQEAYSPAPRTQPSINVFTGPPQLRNINGDLSATVWSRIEGFEALERIGGSLAVSALELIAFPVLTSVEGNLVYSRVGGADVMSFAALTHVGGNMIVQSNLALRSLAGFGALAEVGGLLDIRGNPALEALPPKLQYYEALDVRLNPHLSRCAIDALVARARAHGAVAEPTTCCNLGCATCLASSCQSSSSPLEGQSTYYANDIQFSEVFPLPALMTMTRVKSLDLHTWSAGIQLLPLERVDETLYIDQAGQGDLGWFGRLERAGGLVIGNGWMTSLTGLESLRELPNGLGIYNNAQLTDLSALDPKRTGSLEQVGGSSQIYSNPQLSNCEARRLTASLIELGVAPESTYVSNVECLGTCDGSMCTPPPP